MVSTTSPATFSSACCPAPGIDAGVAAATSPAAPGAGIGAADAEAAGVADWRQQPPEAVSASTTTEQVRKAILITEPPRRKLTHASWETCDPAARADSESTLSRLKATSARRGVSRYGTTGTAVT